MYKALSYEMLTDEMQAAIEAAASRVGASVSDVQGYFLAGGEWDAETPAELADEIVTCWQEQASHANKVAGSEREYMMNLEEKREKSRERKVVIKKGHAWEGRVVVPTGDRHDHRREWTPVTGNDCGDSGPVCLFEEADLRVE